MVVWLIKEVFYQRKRHFLTIIVITISIVLVLLVNIISSYIIENVSLSFEHLGLDISSIQLLEKRNDDWIDVLIENYQVEKYSFYNKKQNKDYKIIGCNSNLANIFTFSFESGNFLNEIDNKYNDNQIVIGNDLKQYFNVYQINQLVNVNGITFKVIGILKKDSKNLYENFDDCIFVFSEYVNNYQQSGFYFISENNFEKSFLDNLLTKDTYLFIDQSQTKTSMINLLKLIRNVLLFLSFISVIVSIISIVNNSLTNINIRLKEIGIKKALGASSKDIYIQFILESILIFLIGIIISLAIVYLIVIIINIFSKTEIKIDLFNNLKYIFIILIIGTISNIYPAKKASEITIIETIKNNQFIQ